MNMNDKSIGFGIYHIEYGEPGEKHIEDATRNRIVNTLIVGGYDLERFYKTMMLASKNKCKVWVWINQSIWTNTGFAKEKLLFNWQDTLSTLQNICISTNSMNYLLGFIIEEPLINRFDKEDIITVTKYFREVLKTRVMINLSAYEIDNTIVSHNKFKQMPNLTSKILEYVTDVSIIHYKDYLNYEEEFKHLTRRILSLSQPDTNIWYVACPIKIKSIQTEQQAIEHLEGCYSLLMKAENPGGLICYSWKSDYGLSVGLADLTDAFAEEYWEKIIPKIRDISNEIKRFNEKLLLEGEANQ